ncbi:MAG: hypothetical protein GY803_02440 [Chloroflexi bacterium]|nr:hypothetical protein [Chloroflexota bacterium]
MDERETAAEVNIEEIMREIRADILAKRAVVGSGGEPLVPTSGKRLPPEFYEHMYQAALAYENVGVKMHVTKVNIPLLGGVIEWLRSKLHELTLYYVNQVASQQIEVNYHLLRALAIASQELETEHDEHT